MSPGSSKASNRILVTIRPICPSDEALMTRFHENLSDRSVYQRYFASLSLRTRTAHARLFNICHPNPAREIVLIAEHIGTNGHPPEISAVGRLVRLDASDRAELAVIVCDEFQNQGIGSRLVQALIERARQEKIGRIVAEMLRENYAMQIVLKRAGFRLYGLGNPTSVRACLDLNPA